MAKYFIHAGLEFQTITVTLEDLGFDHHGADTTEVEACTLESIVTALGDFVTGDNDQEKIDNLRGWWGQYDGLDILQSSARALLRRSAPLLDDPIRGNGESNDSNVHRLSHQYILPPHCAEGVVAASTHADDTTRANEHFRIVLDALQVKHDKIRKYDTAEDAWLAWVTYITVQRADTETKRNEGTRAYRG